MTYSNIEFAPLELQRFWGISKNDRDKLRAKSIWRWCRCHPRVPQLGPAARPCGPSGAIHADGGGFALHEAFSGRVVGVSDPRVVQFPPFGDGVAATVQTHWVTTAKIGRFV